MKATWLRRVKEHALKLSTMLYFMETAGSLEPSPWKTEGSISLKTDVHERSSFWPLQYADH